MGAGSASSQAPRRPPSTLGREGRAVWRGYLADRTGWDTGTLALLKLGCEEVDIASKSGQILAREGIAKSSKPHPLVRVQRQAAALAAAIFKQLEPPRGGV